MTDFEDQLRSSLRTRAQHLGAADVQASGLAEAGRREQRRRRNVWTGGALTVAGVAAAAVIATGMVEPTKQVDPEPAPAPSTAAEAMPASYILNRQSLYVGVHQLRLPQKNLEPVYGGGTTVVGAAYDGPYWHVQGDELALLPTGATTFGVLISADGHYGAWINKIDQSSERVVLWDFTTSLKVEEITVDTGPDSDSRLLLAGIDKAGRVFWNTAGLGEVTMWKPGNDPVTVTGLPGPLLGNQPPDTVITGRPGSGMGARGTVDDDGRFNELGPVQDPEAGVWAPDGAHRAITVEGPALQLQDRVGGLQDVIMPSEVSPWIVLGWQSSETFFVAGQTQGDRHSLLRCDVSARACGQLIGDMPPSPLTTFSGPSLH